MPQLTEEMKRLMGIASPGQASAPPTLFQHGKFQEGGSRPARVQESGVFRPSAKIELHEGTMRLFKSVKEQSAALERAVRLVQRVNASVLRTRESVSSGPMNERGRAEMYRLDQELATAMDSIKAAQEAIGGLEQAQREAKRDAREARRQGRRR